MGGTTRSFPWTTPSGSCGSSRSRNCTSSDGAATGPRSSGPRTSTPLSSDSSAGRPDRGRVEPFMAVFDFHGDSEKLAAQYDDVLHKVVAVSSGRPVVHLALPREYGFMVIDVW